MDFDQSVVFGTLFSTRATEICPEHKISQWQLLMTHFYFQFGSVLTCGLLCKPTMHRTTKIKQRD